MEPRDDETDDRPLYSRRRHTILRVMVIIAVGAMVLPLLANLFSVNIATANDACARAVAYAAPDAENSSARFELFGTGGVGWQCYSVGGFGGGQRVAYLGLIPGEVEIPRGVNT